MTLICYQTKRFNQKALATISQANAIIEEFQAQGFTLTLRQLYYQFVGKALIPNTQKSYKRLGHVVSEARLAGLISWDAIEDRTRNVRALPHWSSPADVVNSAARGYHKNLWEDQDEQVEVWIEKDALVGVAERVCQKWDVPLLSCRGYTSQSELWRSAQRHKDYGVPVTVLHFGDHDPSGIDMTRDVQDRLSMFGADTTVCRMMLHKEQVDQYHLPPNPAKTTDSRFQAYEQEHGESSWELDAVNPREIERIAESAIIDHLDVELFKRKAAEMEAERALLTKASKNWRNLSKLIERMP